MVHSAIVFPLNRTPRGLFEADLFAENIFRWGAYSMGLFGGGGCSEVGAVRGFTAFNYCSAHMRKMRR